MKYSGKIPARETRVFRPAGLCMGTRSVVSVAALKAVTPAFSCVTPHCHTHKRANTDLAL